MEHEELNNDGNDKNLLTAAMKYLNSNEFTGPFFYGLCQETPPGWNPLYDYSLLYGYLNHFPLKTKEMLDDTTLPFNNLKIFFLDFQWFEVRVEILLKEIISSMTNDLSFDNPIRTPEEWYEHSSSKVSPMILTRFHFLRLLRAFYFYGLKIENTIQENFDFLINQSLLNDFSKKIATHFLSQVYNRCKKCEPSLFYDVISVDSKMLSIVDESWISDNQISAICDSLLLLQNVRKNCSMLSKEAIMNRFECCPPWEVNPKNWSAEKDFFLFSTVNDIGFSSLVQFFVDPNSPFYENGDHFEELKKLREIERSNVSPHKSLPLNKYQFMFKYEKRFNRIKRLVDILCLPNFEEQMISNYRHFHIFPSSSFGTNFTSCLTVLNEGEHAAESKAPIGYFAFRLIVGQNACTLVSCTVGGTKSLPIYQLNLVGKKTIKFFDLNIDKVMNSFRNAVQESQEMFNIPKTITGNQFFGFDDKVIQALIK